MFMYLYEHMLNVRLMNIPQHTCIRSFEISLYQISIIYEYMNMHDTGTYELVISELQIKLRFEGILGEFS